MLAACLAARLDRELADGARPEASASLAARAARLTSMEFRRDLATSLQRILAAAGWPSPVTRALPVVVRPPRPDGRPSPGTGAPRGATTQPGARRVLPAAAHPSAGVACQPHVPLRRARISRSAPELAELAGYLVKPGPVPVRGVAMVSQLLADGRGPLYREDCRDDLGAIIERVAHALTR
jgi:hypothetical protein